MVAKYSQTYVTTVNKTTKGTLGDQKQNQLFNANKHYESIAGERLFVPSVYLQNVYSNIEVRWIDRVLKISQIRSRMYYKERLYSTEDQLFAVFVPHSGLCC